MYGFIFTKGIIGILHNFFRKIGIHLNISYFIISHFFIVNQIYQDLILRKKFLESNVLGRKILPPNQMSPTYQLEWKN